MVHRGQARLEMTACHRKSSAREISGRLSKPDPCNEHGHCPTAKVLYHLQVDQPVIDISHTSLEGLRPALKASASAVRAALTKLAFV